jgi:hypothetical protein
VSYINIIKHERNKQVKKSNVRNSKEHDNKDNKIWKQRLESKNLIINDAIESFKKEIINKMLSEVAGNIGASAI